MHFSLRSSLAVSALLAAAPLTAQQELLDAARQDPRLSTLVKAVAAAGLQDALATGPLTVLAPRNEAFSKLPSAALDGLLADQDALTRVLTDHVVAGANSAVDLLTAGSVTTLTGGSWPVSIDGGRLKIGGAAVIDTLEIGGSVVHVLDTVLLRATAEPAVVKATQMPAIYSDVAARDLREARAKAAAGLEAGLEGEGIDREQLLAAVEAALPMLAGHPRTAANLRAAVAKDVDAGDLYALVERAVADLRFRPVIEAEVPLGWPDTAPVGEIVLKSYPRYRMAVTAMAPRTGTNRSFFALFNHIKKNDIAMTAPVQVDYDGEAGEAKATETMAFLYAHPNQGEAGADGNVDVVNVDPVMAVSIGLRGYERSGSVEAARRELNQWLQRNADFVEAAGPMRTMGYNSPMVGANRRFYEVEIPVRMKPAAAKTGTGSDD